MERQLKRIGYIQNAFLNFKKTGTAKMTMGACLSRTEQLKARWRDFDNVHKMLEDDPAVDTEIDYFKQDLYSSTYEDYLVNLGLFQDFQLTLQSQSVEQTAPGGVVADTDMTQAKLPPIVIAPFSGDIQDWVRFRDTFKGMVFDRPNLPNIFKMNYLRTYVRGEAAELLQEVPSGGEHLVTAWKVLLSHYDNKKLLINKLMTKLMSLPAMTNESASELMRVLNGVRNLLQALKALGSPTEHWEHFTVFLTRSKITQKCQAKWEDSVKRADDPTRPDEFENLCKFLEAERNALSLLESTKDFAKRTPQAANESKTVTSKGRKSANFVQVGAGQNSCPVCSELHSIENCPAFRKLSVEERKRVLGQKRLCYQCLGAHLIKDCETTTTCFSCNGKHHTLIHLPSKKSKVKNEASKRVQEEASSPNENSTTVRNVLAAVSFEKIDDDLEALLATAHVRISADEGPSAVVRALVDQCAQSSFITEELCQRLQLKKRRVNVPISDIGEGRDKTRAEVEIVLRPHFQSPFELSFKAYVLPLITTYQPSCQSAVMWELLKGLQLADPYFSKPGRVDVLLGTEIHARVVQNGLIKGDEKAPIAIKSQLGWILSGSAKKSKNEGTTVCVQTEDRLGEQLKAFWEVEEPPHVLPWSSEDKMCEEHYVKHTVRLNDGRYQVRLPIKPKLPANWENSRQIARSCLLSLERKLCKNPALYEDYKNTMRQMIRADQMRKIKIKPQDTQAHYFLPHHAVVKESSTTTRVRPVFNASARNASGHSLNEHLMTGPNLLPHIVLVLAHWRRYPVAFVADVSKMYLQARLHPEDWKFQSILWREDPKEEMEDYVLTTVTFGSGPSAYLANRTLRQLAEDEGNKYPLAAPIVRSEMYMDDVLSGAFDVKLALHKQRQLSALLSSGGFTLAKWMTNDEEMLHSFDADSLAKEATLKVGLGFSVLGLVWEPKTDVFRFNVSLTAATSPVTKRKVLSCIAGLFDPSGWIAPVLISLKIFMQSLWLVTKEWDTPLPDSEIERWREFEQDLKDLPSIAIPRWIGFNNDSYVELHGFADASKFAYVAVIYVRLVSQGEVRVSLLAAKTKVAPIKTLSIPRLELCAAHLLAKLAASVASAEEYVDVPLHLWSDSKTTLHWIHGLPACWPVFVANRCAEIINLAPKASWHYVNTKHNPADVASRGCSVPALREDKLWWLGPEALVESAQP
uniref:Peptidase aspartic putative domain-containing protein n=1 Tax=Trichogramma kaykai TaxID=54128 RepID=A0ABD2X276_9HYME